MWAAIVSSSSEERRGVALAVLERLRSRGVSIAGALQQAAATDADIGWDATDLITGARLPIARRSDTPEVCDWGFEESTFEAIRRSVAESNAKVVVLEFGILEARGRGNWATALEALSRGQTLIASIRPTALARIALELPDPGAALELPVDELEIEAFVESVASASQNPATEPA
jgi:hypothetical protein